MFKLANQLTKHLVLAGLALGAMGAAHADTKYPGIGREATKAEVAAWM